MSQKPAPKLLDQVRYVMRVKHYSLRTEETYIYWIKRYVKFYQMKQHPKDMNSPEIEAFLSHLAINKHVAPSTQNQALSALLFLYQQVLDQPLDYRIDAVRAKKEQRLPVVLSRTEVNRLINHLPNQHQLPVRLMYGCGLRLMECLRLRVKDVDFEQHQIIVRNGKGNQARRYGRAESGGHIVRNSQ